MTGILRQLHRLRQRRASTPLLLGVVGLVLATCAPGFAPTAPVATTAALDEALEAPAAQQIEIGQPESEPVPQDDVVLPAAPVDGAAAPPPPAPPPPDAGPQPAEPVVFPPIVVQEPRLRIDGLEDGRRVAEAARGVQGVSHAAALTIGVVPIAGGGGPTTVTMAAIDPVEFRTLTPQVTADAVAVWERLMDGDAAFTHEAGHRLQLELGKRVPAAGRTLLRVGAYASNGVPPVAEAIVARRSAEELALVGTDSVLIAVVPDARPQDVAGRLRQALGVEVRVLEEPQQQRAFLTGAAARKAFEPFTYIDMGDGMIQIDRGWVRRNIVSASMPLLRGHVLCHRLLITQLRGALQEVEARGLGHLINPRDYGGCWVPRHIDFNPSKPLSMHAWGLAVDFNVSTNQLGAVPQMDPRIVEIFQRWGFVWGGHWRRPDGMHFELGALLQSPRG